DFRVNDQPVGVGDSEVRLDGQSTVRVTAQVAARLGEQPNAVVRRTPLAEKPYWDLERARVANTREVPVELIVNGQAVARKNILADGTLRPVSFEAAIAGSSWVALRILPSSHTNPIFVLVDGKPIRASRRSAEWCLKAVDQCWRQKAPQIAEKERDDAAKAYDHAREVYRRILAESVTQ
ncbi:MAG: CehA/McbA family metallohydrolase, partial [Vicinamibacteraceae bacterium]